MSGWREYLPKRHGRTELLRSLAFGIRQDQHGWIGLIGDFVICPGGPLRHILIGVGPRESHYVISAGSLSISVKFEERSLLIGFIKNDRMFRAYFGQISITFVWGIGMDWNTKEDLFHLPNWINERLSRKR